jgi:hypothetical protein
LNRPPGRAQYQAGWLPGVVSGFKKSVHKNTFLIDGPIPVRFDAHHDFKPPKMLLALRLG